MGRVGKVALTCDQRASSCFSVFNPHLLYQGAGGLQILGYLFSPRHGGVGGMDLSVLQAWIAIARSARVSFGDEPWWPLNCLSQEEIRGGTRALLRTYLVLSLPVQGVF